MNKRDLVAQLKKLAAIGPLPPTEEAVSVLIEVLRNRCASIEHVERVMSYCCYHCYEVPKPVELAAICEQTKASNVPLAKEGCPLCGGSGYQTTYYLRSIYPKKLERIEGRQDKPAWWVAHAITGGIVERNKRGQAINQYVVEAASRCRCVAPAQEE